MTLADFMNLGVKLITSMKSDSLIFADEPKRQVLLESFKFEIKEGEVAIPYPQA